MKKLKEWHKSVCEKTNYKCQKCGKNFNYPCYFDGDVNQYVTGHHVKSQGSHPELKFEVSNGICLCLECHNGVHSGNLTL